MSDQPLHVLIRVWMPDRPGALGLVASRIGAVDGDIVGIDVLEQGDGVAVDEFAVLLAPSVSLDLLVREILEVDGTTVEEVRTIASFPDPRLDALESAASITGAASGSELQALLVDHVRGEFLADWCVLVSGGAFVSTAGEPTLEPSMIEALVAGFSVSPKVADGTTGPDDLALAALPDHDAVLLVSRAGHAFRRRERAQLLALAGIADRVWSLVS